MACPLTIAELAEFSRVVDALTGAVSIDAMTAALQSAWEEAEGYLRTAEYVLPLPTESVTSTMRRKAYALAEWELFGAVGFDPTSATNDLLRTRYEDAVDWWGRVAKGQIQPIPRNAAGLSDDATPTLEELSSGSSSDSLTARGWGGSLLE